MEGNNTTSSEPDGECLHGNKTLRPTGLHVLKRRHPPPGGTDFQGESRHETFNEKGQGNIDKSQPSLSEDFSTFSHGCGREKSKEKFNDKTPNGSINYLWCWWDYLWWMSLPENSVLDAEKVPIEMRENYILTGYRPPGLGVIPSAKSAFYIHNETLNFWTHMIPFIYFAYNLFLDQGPWLRLALISPLGRYPFYGYMVGICSLFGASSFAHLFHCAGRRRWRNVCFVMDYAAISVYGTASAISYYFYSRPRFRGTFIGYLLSGEGHFLGITTATGWVATWASCLTRLRPSRFCYAIRTAAFALPFIVGSFPALARWLSAGAALTGSSANEHVLAKLSETERAMFKPTNATSSYYRFPNLDYDFQTPYTRHLVMLAGGALINVLKIPERFWPGKFDALGSSHQWFHILVFFSIREQFWLMLEEIACHSGMLYLRDPDSSMPWGRATIKPGRSHDAYCTIITSTSYTIQGAGSLHPGSTYPPSSPSFSTSSSPWLFPWSWGSLLLCALCNPRSSLDTWMVLNTITWMTVLLSVLTITIVWFGYSYNFEFTSSTPKTNRVSRDSKKESPDTSTSQKCDCKKKE